MNEIEIVGYDSRMFIVKWEQFKIFGMKAREFVVELALNPKVQKIEIKKPKK